MLESGDTPSYYFGANILENLTTGMYKDSKVIYREYIQNACDQIDKAVFEGTLKKGEGIIEIWLDTNKRTISIEDNATGISAATFKQTLGNIADSDKKIGEDKGFRGIGRLSGLAYCTQLVFQSVSKGEDLVSSMVCDAKKMRHLIDQNQRGEKKTANEVLHAINRFETEKNLSIDSHFFKVTLLGINEENTDLLNFNQVKDYLSFVAPVPYQSSFYYRNEIYGHAQKLGVNIDEYVIKLNGEQIFKKYTTVLNDSSGNKYDDIFGVHCHDFYDEDGSILAWMWVGLSTFQKAIPKANKMRGLRLRKENIQIGGEDSLQKLFKEDRGNSYYIGEVFALHKGLIPNSQRDYFNENIFRAHFEYQLTKYFYQELHKIYHTGSALNSAFKKIEDQAKVEAEFNDKVFANKFVDTEHQVQEMQAVAESKKAAEEASDRIAKMKNKAGFLEKKVIEKIEDARPRVVTPNNSRSVDGCQLPILRGSRRTDKLLKRNSLPVIVAVQKIYKVVLAEVDPETAERIISRIEEELQ